jgi:renalase
VSQNPRIAIIGAGVAGLACANALRATQATIAIFDKGRGPGGRLSTRRTATAIGEAQFDHGAQFFTARDPVFEAEVHALATKGFTAKWQGRFVSLENGIRHPLREKVRWAGAPGMNGLVKGLSQGHSIRWGTRVERVSREGQGWALWAENGDPLGHYDAVVVAIPAEQAAILLADTAPELAANAVTAHAAPCWAALLAFDSVVDPGFDGAKFVDHPTLGWVARNSSKPGRIGPEAWVVHASPEWSANNLEREAESVAQDLSAAFASALSIGPIPQFCAAHRWRFAQTVTPAGNAFLFDRDQKIATCGDWHQGARIEFAWRSGHSLGHALAEALCGPPTNG